jgi:hypothetical protein
MSAVHPWESGMDNTPPWTEYLKYRERSAVANIIGKVASTGLLDWSRRDGKETDLRQRTKNTDIITAMDITMWLKRARYDAALIRQSHEPLVEDVGMNSILVRNNTILRELADDNDLLLSEGLRAKMSQTEHALSEQLFNHDTQTFCSRKTRTRELLETPTVASLLPIYAGTISTKQANIIIAQLQDRQSFASDFAVPSVSLSSEYFDENRMWRGPIWMNINWLMIDGLKRAGASGLQEKLTESTIHTVYKSGMREYYSPLTGKGLGIHNFSWTAAVVADLIRSSQSFSRPNRG